MRPANAWARTRPSGVTRRAASGASSSTAGVRPAIAPRSRPPRRTDAPYTGSVCSRTADQTESVINASKDEHAPTEILTGGVTRRAALQGGLALGAVVGGAGKLPAADAAPTDALKLWYQQPAAEW